MVDNVNSSIRSDVVAVESAPRPTPAPVRVPFKQILANVGVRAAQTAMATLPGAPLLATALRGPAVPMTSTPGIALTGVGGPGVSAVSTAPEGPAAVGTSGSTGAAGDVQSALAQSQSNEMQMLALQTQVAAQQNSFTVMSNILKSESDTEKNAINNIK